MFILFSCISMLCTKCVCCIYLCIYLTIVSKIFDVWKTIAKKKEKKKCISMKADLTRMVLLFPPFRLCKFFLKECLRNIKLTSKIQESICFSCEKNAIDEYAMEKKCLMLRYMSLIFCLGKKCRCTFFSLDLKWKSNICVLIEKSFHYSFDIYMTLRKLCMEIQMQCRIKCKVI